MAWRQAIVATAALLIAYAIQLTVLSRIDFPGATPELVLVVVCALAMSMGPLPGAIIGFAAGLALDIAPPADGTLGIQALIYLIAGFSVGFLYYAAERPVLITIGVVALAAGAAPLVYAAISGLVGSPRVIWESVPLLVVTSAAYAAILTPFVVPGLSWIVVRTTDVSKI